MSVPTDPNQPQAAFPAAPGGANQRLRGLRPLTWLLLFAIVGPCALTLAPGEIGRWYLAQALNLRDHGQKQAAYEKLATAVAWFPKNPELLLQRAEWRLEDGEREDAMADCDQMLE